MSALFSAQFIEQGFGPPHRPHPAGAEVALLLPASPPTAKTLNLRSVSSLLQDGQGAAAACDMDLTNFSN
ncbi:MAG TPA: hypothetical protein VGB55_01780 [Tepidisphaeraceae bacterium]